MGDQLAKSDWEEIVKALRRVVSVGMKRQRQDRRNILETKSIGCHKAICQIKASKVISDNQYWQHFTLKPCCVGRDWGGRRL